MDPFQLRFCVNGCCGSARVRIEYEAMEFLVSRFFVNKYIEIFTFGNTLLFHTSIRVKKLQSVITF